MWWVMALVGCAEVQRAEQFTIPGEGVSAVRARVERGLFSFDVGDEDAFAVNVTSWGRGSSRRAAARHEAGNVTEVETVDHRLEIRSISQFLQAGADVAVVGPEQVSLDIAVEHGSVDVRKAVGSHHLVGERVDSAELGGNATIEATLLGADIGLVPYDDCVVNLDITGNTILRLPRFGPYDLVVETSDDAVVDIEDIGFDVLTNEPGRIEAWRSPGSCVVRVTVFSGGSFQLRGAM